MSGQAPRRLQRGRRAARRTLQRPVSAGGSHTSALCVRMAAVPSRLHFNEYGDISFGAVVSIRDLNKLRVVTKCAEPVRGAARARRTARVFGSTHARRTACVCPQGVGRDLDGMIAGGFSHSLALAGNVVV
ncbi:hypothetical protein EVAR_90131_1 [Eumeta japonica]|uniref:Uncharacterized protein n=1 Tax=Eumeta variegata TaxID=151549 RepID=A0A4C2A3K8_EUMVA|nr:hypothetical protein EVAR_90131_1 [Eumeta japonica]